MEVRKCVFTNDNNVEISLIEHPYSEQFVWRDQYEPQFRKIHTFLINNDIIDKKKNIIDLGAWIGDNTIPWAKNIPSCLVYAIDPSAKNLDFITRMCHLNDIQNVRCLNHAISDRNEIVSTNDDLHHCSFVFGNPGTNGKTKIETVSLDYLHDQKYIDNIGYIHLDVEGMEYRVIRGADPLIDTYKPIITFEQHLEIDDYGIICRLLKIKEYSVFLIDEILPGCRPDCRNFIAFPRNTYNEDLIRNIDNHIGREILVQQ